MKKIKYNINNVYFFNGGICKNIAISSMSLMLMFSLSFVSPAYAFDYTWAGAVDEDFSKAGNYRPSVGLDNLTDGDRIILSWVDGSITNLPQMSGGFFSTKGHLHVGLTGQSGSLSVVNGGQIDLLTPDVNPIAFTIGDGAGASGTVTINGAGSKLSSYGLEMGKTGSATLNVTDGGTLLLKSHEATALIIGEDGSPEAEVIVDGVGSNISGDNINNDLMVILHSGQITVKNGGLINNLSLELGSGIVNVVGAGAQWIGDVAAIESGKVTAHVGFQSAITSQRGAAVVNILNGGKMNSSVLVMGEMNESIVNIDGDNSHWEIKVNVDVSASNNQSNVNLSNGGTITSSDLYIGGAYNTHVHKTDQIGEVTIDGSGSGWSVRSDSGIPDTNTGPLNGIVIIGKDNNAQGTLILRNGGFLRVEDVIIIAQDTDTIGVLNIGAGQGNTAEFSGELVAKAINFGAGTGVINFNHTDNNYIFAQSVNGNGAVNQINGKTLLTGHSSYTGVTTIAAGSTLQLGNGGETGSITSDVTNAGSFIFNRSNDLNYVGKISGDGVFEQIGTGKAVLGGDSSGFAGSSFVRSGILAVDGQLGGTMDVVAGRLQGIGTVGSTTHEAGATIAPGNGGFETLTISGDYIGKGGTVEIVTVLGDDNSQTSRLAIAGGTSGTGNVHITNRDGLGTYTSEGIRIISVGGISDATFTLVGNGVTKDGQPAVVKGAYSYTLEKNGIANPNDGAWYLRSQLKNKEPSCEDTGTCPPETPQYNPGTPVYEGYGQTMQALNKLPTLQQRVGNRYWSGASNPVIEQGADAIGTPLVHADATIDTRGIWGRIEGAHNRFESSRSTTAMKQDVDTFIMQAGVDGQLYEGETGKLIGGITGQYGKANSKITSDHGDGKIDTHGWGLGGTLTWYDDNGFYADAQAQAMWYDSDLNSTTANQSLINDNKGFGYGLSLEAGKQVDLDANWSLTPQAQMVWSSVKFDTFNDAWGASVSNRNGDSLNARLGLSADYRNAWAASRGMIARSHLYGIVNLYQEFMSGNKVTVADVDFRNDNDKTWGGIGAGGTYAWADDKYALYGEGSLNTSLSNFAGSYAVKGTVGFRVRW
ncbi:autotransporter outer membrane beta-barrel domain-containing protein [Pseudochrobactrum kiredjianiae]|uniref:autotransporter outer membrane beta-barrel domain-containing protein n=1 Tax=Pseudochrobactrum kiredjianiae TaxID=386305 RepID=UPI0025A0F289|nr:autotransporter outer membrane beta-barrel domain-containing protein [Pseudochrobactrum kiredjianiae]MDM7852781.1 autotransporter outer membrane beta-barrel domain-containing protein [Pseudochrobactrum kiredjianiae]